MVTTLGLSKVFTDRKRGAVLALDEVSFEARPGEVFGVLGVNGAGKPLSCACWVLSFPPPLAMPPSRATVSVNSRKKCASISAT